jgi:ABC-type bacteriocin/lantibiotic exporter with double-glycine peptidase domain
MEEYFKPIRREVERKKAKKIGEPLTVAEHETAGKEAGALKDNWRSLRQAIQVKTVAEKSNSEETERTKLLSELVTPRLMEDYKNIVKNLSKKSKKTVERPRREFVDIDSAEFSDDMEKWIEALISEVKVNQKVEFDNNDLEDLRAQCWLFFDSVCTVTNTKTVESDILDFYKGKNKGDKKAQTAQRKELIIELQKQYPLDKAEVEILLDIVHPDENKEYSLKVLTETIGKIWEQYNLGEQKGRITKISLGYLMAEGAKSFAPSLFQGLLVDDKFSLMVFLEYFGLNKISTLIDAKTEVELAKVMNQMNHQINERITNSLFFQEFEFIHERSLGEIYTALEKGKQASEDIMRETIAKFLPTLAGIGMSLGFLAKINPILGAIGLASLPVMYKIAKNQNDKISPIYEAQIAQEQTVGENLGNVISGAEGVRTMPNSPDIAKETEAAMNERDDLYLKRHIKEVGMYLKRMIPFDIATVSAAVVGAALQTAGQISGGAVLSNIIYSNQLNGPVRDLVDIYFNKFSRHIQSIQKMDGILGQYEKLDLPEGEKEKNRIPVSELKDFNISIKNLNYKNILRNVSLDVNQGEFLTIAGASGAGKSTLLRNLVGLYKPENGSIKIGGVENDKIKKYGEDSIYSVISYCNQNPQIFSGKTLRENLLLWSKEGAKGSDDENIKKVLRDLNLDGFADRLDEEIKHFSGGEKVRIGVARTLIKGAKIMLLDEPTASLDSQSSTEVRKALEKIRAEYPETTIICVTHDTDLIELSERKVNMKDL